MSIRISILILFLLSLQGSVSAMTCVQVSGFSSFSCTVGSYTLTIEETLTGTEGIIALTLNCSGAPPNDCDDNSGDGRAAWAITKTVTNGTGDIWVNVDTELKVGCDVACGSDSNSCDGASGTTVYCPSNNFDGTQFDQANTNRTVDSNVFSTVRVDELDTKDFIQFDTCTPTGTTLKKINGVFTCVAETPAGTFCCTVGTGSSDQVSPAAADIELFPVSSDSIINLQLVQTPNFGITTVDEGWGWTHRP